MSPVLFTLGFMTSIPTAFACDIYAYLLVIWYFGEVMYGHAQKLIVSYTENDLFLEIE